MTTPATPPRSVVDFDAMIAERSRRITVTGIRRVFELGAKLANPINLSIGQPDFAVPEALKQATIDAIRADRNGYTLTQGAPELVSAIKKRLADDIDWAIDDRALSVMVTAGTSGGILLAALACLDVGDELIIPDPYFVIYPAHGVLSGATVVHCDTYPDCRMTAQRIEPLITERTKMVLLNSPGNPSGVVLDETEVREVAELCEQRGVLLLTDEIYDEFTFSDARESDRCPSPARYSQSCLLVRGFGKTYGCTGWRLGYVAGPTPIIREMMKLQQYSFVCAPSMAQIGIAGAFDIDMRPQVDAYEKKRERVLRALGDVAEIPHPGGAFYAFVKVPERLGLTATEFCERAIERNLLIIPGSAFSRRDTHFRLSFAAPDERLDEGLALLREMLAD